VRQAGLPLLVKQVLDRTVAGLGLLAAAPILATTAAAVALSMGRPVVFRQRRPGLHGRPFEIAKFRTMSDARDASGAPLPDGERLTAVGKFLRRASLDELPQLWNVVRGELSLVGPRPLMMQYLDRYDREQARRHDVLPGITGWAQIHGRNAVDWDARFRFDVWYVDHWSLWLDLKILALTVLTLARRDGISRADHATMPEFLGSDRRDDGRQGDRDRSS
jgi:lipopolysaccharide/colanic/teichoic acid biosynthesis glycosyltransferase